MEIERYLAEKARQTEAALAEHLASWSEASPLLKEAASYSLFAGGKRIRPALVLGAAEIISGNAACAMPAACAIEMIHTYSLIHDDLPAMDDDDLRRGKPTLHKVYGEAIAILAGDALLTMAFDLLAQTGDMQVVREVAQASGPCGMAGGQAMDLQSEGQAVGLETLRVIHARKTGALIRVSLRTGAMLAAAAEDQLAALTKYGEALGLAFQIADDILDVVGQEAAMGKAAGSDAAHAKSTYPALMGLERARQYADAAAGDAVAALRGFGPEADIFRTLARYVVTRDK